LAEFVKQLRINAVSTHADGASMLIRFNLCQHGATGFVQMRAVIELATTQMLSQIGHTVGQAGGLNVVQAKFLKAG
jgi:hypothetical protein